MTSGFFKKTVALILCTFMLAGCKADYKGLEKPLNDAFSGEETVSNGGLASKKGQWIYYINGDNFTRHEGERYTLYAGALCRMKEDGSSKAVVINKDVTLFYIQGDRVYLCLYENGSSVIASVRLDGTDYILHEKIDDVYFGGGCDFSKEYIYYTKDFKLWRMDFSGKNKTKITDFPIYNLRAGEESVFFTREENENIGSLYKIDGDGFVEITKEPAYLIDIFKDKAYYYMLDNGTVYEYSLENGTADAVIYGGYTDYLFLEDNGGYLVSYTLESESEDAVDGIYYIEAGGGAKQPVSKNSGSSMVFYDGYVYYVNVSTLNYLFRFKLDGTADECVSEEFVYSYKALDIVDNYLYFLSDSDYDSIYRVNMDSCEVECVEYEDISIVG